MIIIRKDTVWGPGLKTLNDDVQIAAGAKLTVQAGAHIEGNGHSISAFGSFVSAGTGTEKNFINNTRINFGTGYDPERKINIDNTHINGGSLLGSEYGNITLTNSVVTSASDFFGSSAEIYMWYNTGRNQISGNIFLGGIKLSVGSNSNFNSNVEIDHNIFGMNSRLEVWASYGTEVVYSHHNAFDYTGSPVMIISIDGQLKSRNDYFGTDDARKAQTAIKDGRDDLRLGTVDLDLISTSIPNGVRTDLFSFTSVELPQASILEARLLGSESVNITGNKFSNKLTGNVGNNVIDGGLGADTMSGGAGNDTYMVENPGDRVIEAAGEGYDVVAARGSYRLEAGQEIEELRAISKTVTTAVTLTGNEFANKIVGNAGANVLDGGGGIDALYGEAGNDTYLVDNAGDQVFEGAGKGTDAVSTRVSYTLAAGQEIEELRAASKTGVAALVLTGNGIDNKIVANAGNNVLNGKGGADLLYGLSGQDTFVFDTALGSGNVDRIADFSGPDDTIQLARSVFTALGAGPLTASAFKDVSTQGPVDADDRILYSSKLGTLSYDADGSGSKAAVQFAIIDTKVTLTASDFFVV